MTARTKKPALVDEKLVEALSHPKRAHALNILTQRPASATELAREVGETPSGLAYHVKKLLSLGCIEPVEERKVRSATEVLYRATVRHYFDADAWKAVPNSKRLRLTMNVLRLISKDVNDALEAETADATERHLSRTYLKLDSAGWMEILFLLEATLEEVLTIRERATTRMAKSDEKSRSASVSIMHFEIPDAHG